MKLRTAAARILLRLGYEVRPLRPRRCEQRFCDVPLSRLPETSCQQSLNRVLVITQPKAGTYLVAQILKESGFEHTHLHLGRDRLQAYDPHFLHTSMQNPSLFNVFCPIQESRNLIRFGQVAVSHICYEPHLAEAFSNFRIIHVKRELSSSIRSLARMYLHSDAKGRKFKDAISKDGVSGLLRLRGRRTISEALEINKWSEQENVISLKIEDIKSSPEQAIDAILNHVHHQPERSAQTIWNQAVSAGTLTKAAHFPELDWTEEDEAAFMEIGGHEANRALGYA